MKLNLTSSLVIFKLLSFFQRQMHSVSSAWTNRKTKFAFHLAVMPTSAETVLQNFMQGRTRARFAEPRSIAFLMFMISCISFSWEQVFFLIFTLFAVSPKRSSLNDVKCACFYSLIFFKKPCAMRLSVTQLSPPSN